MELDVEELVNSNHVQEDEKSSLLSKSDLEIKDGSNVMALVVVEEIESGKEIPQEVKPILEEVMDILSRKHVLMTSMQVKVVRLEMV